MCVCVCVCVYIYIYTHMIPWRRDRLPTPVLGFPWCPEVKNLPATQETWVQSLGWEDPLEKGMATHSRTLAWRISMDRGAWWATVHGVTKTWTWLSNKAHSIYIYMCVWFYFILFIFYLYILFFFYLYIIYMIFQRKWYIQWYIIGSVSLENHA